MDETVQHRGERVSFFFDDADAPLILSMSPWFLSRGSNAPYVAKWIARNGSRRLLLLHRFLCGLDFGDKREVDHIDGNTLNNRRSNLRIVSHAEQMQNRAKHRRIGGSPTSRFRNVVWDKGKRKWHAQIKLNRKRIHLGYFNSEFEAAKAAERGRAKYFSHAVEDRHKVVDGSSDEA